jgi:DNA mismatch repair protein MutS2
MGSSSAARPGARPSGITVHTSAPSEDDAAAGADEINVIGCTVDEATRLVDKFLDTAALNGKSEVRIIHGHGTGALRRGLAEFFAAHPLVERIHAEADDRGGSAVTVVELKG